MEYYQCREKILNYLISLQRKGLSYQAYCDYINAQDLGFKIYKDFFTRFRGTSTYYKGKAKYEKLLKILACLEQLHAQNITEKDVIDQHLQDLIGDALKVEFAAYAEVNKNTTDFSAQLAKYFERKKPAFLAIKNNLKHKKQFQWELDISNHGSNFELLSTEVVSVFNTSAVIKTNEYWKICWVDIKSRKVQYNFDAINNQTYLITKNKDQNWKIVENIYQSSHNRIRPEYTDFDHLESLAKDDLEVLNTHAQHFLANNNLLQLSTLIKLRFQNQLTNIELQTLDKINESYIETHRMLNTNVIKLSRYKEDIDLLKNQFTDLLSKYFPH